MWEAATACPKGRNSPARLLVPQPFNSAPAQAHLLTLSCGKGIAGAVRQYRCQKFLVQGRYQPFPGRTRDEDLAPRRGELERHLPGLSTGKVSMTGWQSWQGGLIRENPSWWPQAACAAQTRQSPKRS